MLTTNALLGGVTFVVAIAKLAACIWLIKNVCQRIAVVRKETHPEWSRMQVLMNYPAIRMMTGAATTFFGAFIIFGLRIPLRGVREAGNVELGDAWLRSSVYWELPAMVLVVTGMAMVMWPAFDKHASRGMTIAVLFLATLVTYLLGAALVNTMSVAILSVWE